MWPNLDLYPQWWIDGQQREAFGPNHALSWYVDLNPLHVRTLALSELLCARFHRLAGSEDSSTTPVQVPEQRFFSQRDDGVCECVGEVWWWV